MFCPSCGIEERQLSQYCRTCGTDLRAVRVGLEKPDAITASAASARDEIGRAIAAKIREMDDSRDLKRMAEDVLPEIEKFLESPQERRLRRLRAGTITSAVGLGAMIMFSVVLAATHQDDVAAMIGAGAVAFLIGLGILINAWLFTLPSKQIPHHVPDALAQNALDQLPESPVAGRPELTTAQPLQSPLSVIEHTTHRLKH